MQGWALGARHSLLSLHGPWNRHSLGTLSSAFGGQRPGLHFLEGPVPASGSQWEAATRALGPLGTLGPTAVPRGQDHLPPPPTCRWVMFLSMFMGDVTQFWETYL